MTKEQFETITKWQKEVFPKATSYSKLRHLREEINELEFDLAVNSPEKRLEFADCFFLLFGAAAKEGMSYEDICEAINEKFRIVKKRTWQEPDENGVVRHVK